ncbi:MAG: helix-turn-helix domain-containing protein [Planctomycetota bacterium]
MRLDPPEIQAIAQALAPLVADELERRLSERPEWARSIPEAAAYAKVEPHVIRDAIADGRLPSIHVGRQIRIRRTDLFGLRNGDSVETGDGEEGTI